MEEATTASIVVVETSSRRTERSILENQLSAVKCTDSRGIDDQTTSRLDWNGKVRWIILHLFQFQMVGTCFVLVGCCPEMYTN